MPNDRRKNMLDVGIELVEKSIQRGYIQAWFSWLGWVTVSSVIFVLGSKAQSLPVQALGGVSIVVTILAGFVGIERLRDDWLEVNKANMPRWKSMIVVVSMAIFGVYMIFEIVGVVFNLTVSTNAASL